MGAKHKIGSDSDMTVPPPIGGTTPNTGSFSDLTVAGALNVPAKTTPVDADNVPITDSAASHALKKVTWANLKATLKTYFDGLYATIAQATSAVAITGGAINGTTVGATTPGTGKFTTLESTGVTKAWGVETPIWGGTSGGSANAQTLTPAPAITAYAPGQRFRFIAGYANTGAVTMAVSGLASPRNVKKFDGRALIQGDMLAGAAYELLYDGTNLLLLNPTGVKMSAASTTCDISLTSTFSITGAGFKPRGVIVFAASSGSGYAWSGHGYYIDGNQSGKHQYSPGGADIVGAGGGLIGLYQGAYSVSIGISSMDIDGVTFTRTTNSGTPPATNAHLGVIFIG